MIITIQKNIRLPSWIDRFDFDRLSIQDDVATMDAVIELAHQNIINGTGGPFAAVVVDRGRDHIVSIGLNLVEYMKTSIAHAEIVALLLAQASVNRYRLDDSNYELITLAQPCCMCYGAIFWSGIKKVIYGATREDVQRITRFDEGPLPSNWIDELAQRDISITSGSYRDKACQVLSQYVEKNGLIY